MKDAGQKFEFPRNRKKSGLARSGLTGPHPVCGKLFQIPFNGLAHSGIERFGRIPSQFRLDLRRIDGIAPIVSWSIRDELDQAGELFYRFSNQSCQLLAEKVHDVQIFPAI